MLSELRVPGSASSGGCAIRQVEVLSNKLYMGQLPREKSACPWQKQIGGITIDQGNTLDEQIVADEHRQKIEKEIAKLEKQARTEKQPKKKFELV